MRAESSSSSSSSRATTPGSRPKLLSTNIFHPNVSKGGDICVNTLKQDWKPTHGIRHILMVIRCLLIEPFPESALNDEASKLLLEDYEEYARRAKLMTSIHAASKTILLSVDKANQMPSGKKQLAGMKSPLKDKRKDKKRSLEAPVRRWRAVVLWGRRVGWDRKKTRFCTRFIG